MAEHHARGLGAGVRSQFIATDTLRPIAIDPEKAALMVIDMQYLDAHVDYGIGAVARSRGRSKEFEWYFREMPRIIRNQRKLIDACRRKGIEIVYTRICSLTRDGRDTGYSFSRGAPIVTPVNSHEAQILHELRPKSDDIVVAKTTASAFNSQYNTDRILRNMGIQILLVCGVLSNACVESTVRDAADLGYDVFTVSDASLSFTKAQHELALLEQGLFCSRIRTTREVLRELERRKRAKSKSKLEYSTSSLPDSTKPSFDSKFRTF